jgi:DNA/RNA-binding domain of Phe-tRNA-synthetase-like protein
LTAFRYESDVLKKFAQLNGGLIVGSGLNNGPTSDVLRERFFIEQQTVKERVGNRSLSELVSISAWRSTFRSFGSDPTKYRCAAESLIRRLVKKGDIPSINTLVDIGNLISIRYALPISVMDLRHVQGTITVHFADGNEHYRELNSVDVIHPDQGEVVFSDDTGMVMARRWCWRQSDESASRINTQNIIVTIEAQHEGGRIDVQSAVDDCLALLSEFCGGEYRYGILHSGNPAIV